MTEDELSQKRKKLNDEEQKNRQSFDSWAEEFRKRHESKKPIRIIDSDDSVDGKPKKQLVKLPDWKTSKPSTSLLPLPSLDSSLDDDQMDVFVIQLSDFNINDILIMVSTYFSLTSKVVYNILM